MADKQELLEKVKAIIAEKLNIDKATITADATLESLGVDSLDMLEIIMKLEEQFNIEIDDDQAAEIKTIEQAVSKIQELVG